MQELAERLERILFGRIEPADKRAMNKWADIDHLVGHVRADRDVFITWDKGILNKCAALRDELGIIVETPEKLIGRFGREQRQP